MQDNPVPDTEFCPEFVQGMKDRMDVSYYKYGPVANGFPHKVNAIETLLEKLQLYMDGNEEKGIAPGNTEYLMDAANYAMIEFMHPRHPQAHFKATDSDGSTGRVAVRTGKLDERDNKDVGSGKVYRSPMKDFL